MKIYKTTFDPDTKEVLELSQVSEFGSLNQVRKAYPDAALVSVSARLLIFEGGVAYSDYAFNTGPATPAGRGL